MTALPQPMPWVKINEIYYTPLQVKLWAAAPIWLGTNMASGNYGPQTINQWITVDLTPWLGASDAKMAILSGMMVITGYPIVNGFSMPAPIDPDLHITFKAYGDTGDPSGYMGQTICPLQGDGRRTNVIFVVPLNASKFEYLFSFPAGSPVWDGTTNGGPAYAFDLYPQVWGR